MASRGTWRQNLQLCVLFSCWERAGEGTGCRWFPCVLWLLCGALLFPHGGSTMAPSCPLPSPPALPGHPLGAHVCPKSSALANPDPAHTGALRVELSRSPRHHPVLPGAAPGCDQCAGLGEGRWGRAAFPRLGWGTVLAPWPPDPQRAKGACGLGTDPAVMLAHPGAARAGSVPSLCCWRAGSRGGACSPCS